MNRKIFSALTICLLLATVVAAAGAKSNSKLLVETGWLAAHLNDPNVVVIHVAPTRASYDAGHIPGARFLPVSDVAEPRNGIPNRSLTSTP